MEQPVTYPERMPTHLDHLLAVYDVMSTGNYLTDLAETGLLFQLELPGTGDEVLEITSGRYDGLRFKMDGSRARDKPITDIRPAP